MGFDNECIPNIQSLAGEYFCPVCRLLVYPNEALQSQCTHLYCKPCLTYIVGTTRACPYDGYLVTEADSKPLVESNKTLAETIGKTTVNCLFHRSGCTWQGPLSESTSHCSGCAFGNSPVVCNRCAVQIVHRQVQEHAQSCSGVQPQAQNSEGAQPVTTMNVAVTGDQAQAAAQVAAPIQYAQTSTTSTTPGQDSNQQAVTTTQPQPAVLTAVPTAEQWYQHQQYYQQYPGYDPYQQQYQQHYPYQQPAVAQYQQPQLQPQPQMQSLQNQSQPHPQLPVIAPPQNQVQINPQLQTPTAVQPQTQYQTQPQPQPQAQPQAPPQPHAPLHAQAQPPSQTNLLQPHANLQMPQYQHPYAHMQHQQPQVQAHTPSQTQYQNHPLPQPRPSSLAQQQPIPQTFTSQPGQPVNSNLQPQAQQQSANAVTGYQSFPQPQTHQQMPLGAPQHTLQMHPQGGPQPQAQHTIHMQSQFPQQPTPLRPPQSKTTMQNPQQPVVLPSQGQVPSVPPVPQQPVHSHSHQPVLPVHQRPVMQPVQQQMHQPHVQNQYPFAGQPWGPVQNQVHQHDPHVQQHPHVQSYMRPQGAPQLSQLPPNPYSQQTVASPHSLQAHQAQNLAGRPIAPLHATPAQSVTPSTVGMHVRPTMPAGAPQQSGNLIWTANQTQSSSEQQSVAIPRQMPERQIDNSLVKGAESKSLGTSKKELENTTLVNTIKSENDMTRMDDVGKVEAQDVPESLAAETGKPLLKPVKEEPEKSDNPDNVTAIDDKKQEHPDPEYKDIEDGPKPKTNRLQFEHLEQGTMKSEKDKVLHSQSSGAFPPQAQVQDGGTVQQSHSAAAGDISIHHGSSALQQKPSGPPFLQAPHSGAPHHTQLPVHPPTEFRPIGSGNTPHPGQPLYPPSEQFQLSIYKQPHGAEVSNSGSLGPGPSFGRGPSQYGPLHGSYSHPPFQGEQMPSHVHELDISANQRPSNKDGGGSDSFVQHSGMHSNLMKMNGTSGIDSSLTSEDRLRPFRDENSNLFPQYPAQHNRVEFEGDLKHFPRPPHLGPEPVPRFGSHFNSSRPLERGHHGFGMDLGPQPLDKGSRGLNYESGLNMEPLGGSAPSRRFFPPFHHDDMVHPGDLVERPMGFHENAVGRLDSSRTRPDFLGSFRGYGRHHMDDFTSRSPGSEYRGMMPHGFVPHPGADDVGGRESRRFGDPISSSFGDGRFPALPSHLRRGDIETPGNLQMEEHLRSSDFFAQDGRSNHLRRGEHLGPRNPPGHVRLGEPVGFGAFPGRAGMGESPGPGNFYHQRFGEPGFRSNLPLKGFPSDGGSYPGDFESFDGLRKRKPSKMGWCRICKVDCVTVEGLDMHSQTSEHQKMAMDIVATIKRNAKKQKLPSSDKASIEDADKSKNSSSEGRGNKL